MPDPQNLPSETPTGTIRTDAEFRLALERVRALEQEAGDTPATLERATLQRAIAAFIEAKKKKATDNADPF